MLCISMYRAVGRSENSVYGGGVVVGIIGPLVGIGLTDLPRSGGRGASCPSVPTTLMYVVGQESGVHAYNFMEE